MDPGRYKRSCLLIPFSSSTFPNFIQQTCIVYAIKDPIKAFFSSWRKKTTKGKPMKTHLEKQDALCVVWLKFSGLKISKEIIFS